MFMISRESMKIGNNFRYEFVLSMSSHKMQCLAKYSTGTKSTFKNSRLIRKQFIDHYTNSLNHVFIPSSPVIPLCDASLAFVNAGMNQFKSIFLGRHSPPSSRVVNYQKCIRVGGEHNDLNKVGMDTYHHTFFEMLGNWSFGDYGKEEACKYAWDTLTQLYGIDKNQLYVTYFGGDQLLGMKADVQCRDIWEQIGVPNDRILARGMGDNFWKMGSNGPCGPCTEIHIDKSMHPADNWRHNENSSQLNLTELWNIVFIEFERLNDGTIVPLNKQYIDTGMGFERLVTVIQGKSCNYDTDLFQPLFGAIRSLTNAPIYGGKFGSDDEHSIDTAYRIVADHARMITVSLADGVIPESNYKLRRVMRKAINIGEETFKSGNLLQELSNHVAESLGEIYPEIQTNLKQIQSMISYETELYKTLKASSGLQWQSLVENKPELAAISDPHAAGLVHSYEILQSTLSNNRNLKILPGDVAFKIYDTHGLDFGTIEELAQTAGLTVDRSGFHECLENAKARSRIGITRVENDILSVSTINYLSNNDVQKTNDTYKYNYEFDGVKYRLASVKCKLVGVIINGNLMRVDRVKLTTDQIVDGKIGFLLDKTTFYGHEGGQLSDKGIIRINDLVFNVTQVNKLHGYVIHYGSFDKSSIHNNSKNFELRTGDEIIIEIDDDYRMGLMRNHTATHLLNAALRNIFPVIAQRGSVVKNENLTFKFSTFGKEISPEHVTLIEEKINNCIQSKIPIETKTVNMLQLMGEKNLTIIPDEIYPDTNLRIVEVNGPELKSKEACCGTHVHNTCVLEHFSIIGVSSKGSSSKTVVAVTGKHAMDVIAARKINEITIGTKDEKISKLHVGDVKDANEKRNIVSNFIISKLNSVINSTVESYIVHCFQSHNVEVESIPLQIAIDICADMPIFLIAISHRKFRARCFVPNDCLSSSFNAQLWMEAIRHVVPIKVGSFKDEDPLLNCHTKVLKLPRDEIASLTEKAIEEAEKFIIMNMKQSISKNN